MKKSTKNKAEQANNVLRIFQPGFLTEKQLKCIQLRAEYKSLQEIGTILGITKQGVDDAIRKSYKKISNYCQMI